ncbi:hypothetical protein BMF94_6436 [Rhodotorula taiwanensis]|uniref:Cytochrome b5 heme-binding domain-containing protein n=1 Tax=Rhodotorula taiwanensis TaxID=741276 RepID=A0A2S5B157_9BASI|nr:hypothetical protein BMF94_6436 [Rhodotorula taiwanensis]
MGWISAQTRIRPSSPASEAAEAQKESTKPEFEHVEHVAGEIGAERRAQRASQGRRHRGLQPSPPPEDLAEAAGGRESVDPDHPPFIAPEVVAQHDNAIDGFWIIIEDRVYDCSDFVDLHPGGPEVFSQFGGKQCTWQFWRWHTRRQLEQWSPSLLIGRTFPVPPNPYPEPRRWIKTGRI